MLQVNRNSKLKMRIIKLTAENVKKLSVVEIAPDSNLVEITGKNGSGKTSVLDSIWWAIAGAGNHQDRPIRKGAEKATIKLDMGDLVVTRTFAEGKGGVTTQLKVETDDGARYGSPQSVLDAMTGALSMDPLAFTRMKPADQLHALESLAEDYDFSASRRARQGLYQERRDVNRDVKNLEARIAAHVIVEEPDGAEDPGAVQKELTRAREHNARQDEFLRELELNTERVAGLKNDIAAIKASLEDKETALQALIESRKGMPEPEEYLPISDIEARLSDAMRAEGLRTAAAESIRIGAEMAAEMKNLTEKSSDLSNRMDSLAKADKEAASAIDLGIDGLSLSPDGITLDGIPLDQASDAQQLRLAVAIAMRSDAKLRVIRIRDGSLLDDDSMNVLREMAAEKEFQVWIERVDSSGKIGVVMEDGINVTGGPTNQTKLPIGGET